MLPFGVTIPATVSQRLDIPEGLMNYPVVTIVHFIRKDFVLLLKFLHIIDVSYCMEPVMIYLFNTIIKKSFVT
jgi:hypothetical protein